MIEDPKIMELVKGAADLETAVSSLVEAANAGGRHRQRHGARLAVRKLIVVG